MIQDRLVEEGYIEYRKLKGWGGMKVITKRCTWCGGKIGYQESLTQHLIWNCDNTPIKDVKTMRQGINSGRKVIVDG